MGFRTARLAAGLLQKELADKVGVDQSAISQYESGKVLPRVDVLLKIADACNCTTDDLLRPEAPVN